MSSTADLMWDHYVGCDQIKEVSQVLLSGDKLDKESVRALFRKGYCFAFLLDQMATIEKIIAEDNHFLEIVVLDDPDSAVVVNHQDILIK